MLTFNPKVELRHLGASYRRLEEVLQWDDARFYAVVDTVSLWSPAQQIDHIALVNTTAFHGIRRLIENKDDDPMILRKGGPKFLALPLLLFRHIPRGRAQSPEAFFAAPDVLRATVRKNVADSRSNMSWIAQNIHRFADATGRIGHHVLGNLSAGQWLRFLRVHTQHHLRIVDDIDKARTAAR